MVLQSRSNELRHLWLWRYIEYQSNAISIFGIYGSDEKISKKKKILFINNSKKTYDFYSANKLQNIKYPFGYGRVAILGVIIDQF